MLRTRGCVDSPLDILRVDSCMLVKGLENMAERVESQPCEGISSRPLLPHSDDEWHDLPINNAIENTVGDFGEDVLMGEDGQ